MLLQDEVFAEQHQATENRSRSCKIIFFSPFKGRTLRISHVQKLLLKHFPSHFFNDKLSLERKRKSPFGIELKDLRWERSEGHKGFTSENRGKLTKFVSKKVSSKSNEH